MSQRVSKQGLATRPASPDYEIGYGKPPTASRFKAGQSGNPRGRPRGSKTKSHVPALNDERLKSIVLEEAYRSIRINDAKGEVTVPMAQAIIRSLAVNAAKGNQRAQRLFTDLLKTTERENKRLHDEWLETAIDYKVEWEKEIERCKRLGLDVPAPVPHPDHIVIDMKSGGVRITGPMTKEEKVRWDMLRERKAECDTEIAELERLLHDEPDCPYRDQVLRDIKHEKKIRAMIAKAVPD